MADKRDVSAEFIELLAAACDGTLPDDRLAELEKHLAESEAARQLYIDYFRLDAELSARCQDQRASRMVDQIQREQLQSSPARLLRPVVQFARRPTPFSLIVAALVMLLLVTAMAFMAAPIYRAITRQDVEENHSSPRIVAKISGLHEAVWASGQTSVRKGTPLQAGQRLALDSGFAVIAFADGTEVVLEGPALFFVDRTNRGRLQTGKIVARIRGEKQDFAVDTPLCTVTDLGTEFFVDVQPDGTTDVLVLSGAVEVSGNANATPVQRITANNGLRLTQSHGALRTTPRWDAVRARQARMAWSVTDPIVSYAGWGSTGTYECSATDLADNSQASLKKLEVVSGAAGFESFVGRLNDGEIYGLDTINQTGQSFTPLDGTVVEFRFDTSIHKAGYDIQSITSLSGTGQSRAIQHYRVEARIVGGDFVPLFEVSAAQAGNVNRQSAGEVKIVTQRRRSPLVEGVDALRFTFKNVAQNAAHGETMYREIDITGQPTLPQEDSAY